MEIQPNSTTQATLSPPRKSAAISSDFETFLKMLTVQMQNQDPLNPIDSADYAVQLATFSGVEQQVRTNQILSDLSELLGGSGLGQAAQWIGKDVLAVAPASFVGDPLAIEIPAARRAESLALIVRDAGGAVVATGPVPPGATSIDWDGTDAYGNRLSEGLYRFSVRDAADASYEETPAAVYARVSEVRANEEGLVFALTGGIEVPFSEVTGVRAGV
jgi:flagellar basal-body rod modification protein FlgD